MRRELDEYFDGARRTSTSRARPGAREAAFARRVLAATARIPFGATSTYGEIAAEAGSRARPCGGRRAGLQPDPIVVPCHRVLARNGTLHGYTGGLHRKQQLLELEGVRTPGM